MTVPRFLPQLAFVARLSPKSRRLFDTTASVVAPTRSQVLLQRGDEVTGAYFVLSGALRVYTLSSAGKESLLYRVEAGEGCLLALNAAFSQLRYPAWVAVDSRTARILRIPGLVLRELHDAEPAVRSYTFEVLSSRVFELMSKIDELNTLSVDERLRSYLLRRADRAGVVQATHDELAVHLSTAREVITRKLRQLQERGIIATRRGSIVILRQAELR